MWPKTLTWWLWQQQVSWQILRLDSIIGSSFPIYPSASGKVHCAFLEESELLKFLNELRETRPELTTDDINRFCTELGGDTPGRGGLRLRGNLYGGPLCGPPLSSIIPVISWLP